MKNLNEVISYLEMELADAYALYDEYKGKEASKAFAYLLKASTIEQILDAIKNG